MVIMNMRKSIWENFSISESLREVGNPYGTHGKQCFIASQRVFYLHSFLLISPTQSSTTVLKA